MNNNAGLLLWGIVVGMTMYLAAAQTLPGGVQNYSTAHAIMGFLCGWVGVDLARAVMGPR